MALDTQANRNELIREFPQLGGDKHFEIKSDENVVYNCIAWAMGVSNCWVDYYLVPGHWWPSGVARENTPEALIAAFQAVGFTIMDDYSYDGSIDKVVLYKVGNKWTHASRLLGEGVEYSKFGPRWDATHGRGVFHGTIYGDAYACMGRPAADRNLTIDVMTRDAGMAKANLQRLAALLKRKA